MRKSIDHEKVFAMQYTKLGNSDLNVSKVCIGCKMSQIALDVTLSIWKSSMCRTRSPVWFARR